jgi:pimeloyl-ACP methyl ester carboxylesterase
MKVIRKQITIAGAANKPILIDWRYKLNESKKPILIFCHGFKGFKDFGCFNLIADYFAEQGFVFIKFNFSHNGTSPTYPSDFVDLESFAQNTFSYELEDLDRVIDAVFKSKIDIQQEEADLGNMYLIGHSRGGGIAILKAFEDNRIKAIVTWASVNEWGKFWKEEIVMKWREDGIRYEFNARTQQQMPMYYKIYEDLHQNKNRLNIPFAIQNMKLPFLVVHGEKDETVKLEVALQMKNWNQDIQLKIIPDTNHTFDSKHPWELNIMPQKTIDLVESTYCFLKNL